MILPDSPKVAELEFVSGKLTGFVAPLFGTTKNSTPVTGLGAVLVVAEADMTNGVPGTIRSPFSGAVTEIVCACKSIGAENVKRARADKAIAGREGKKRGLIGGSEERVVEFVQWARIFKRKNCTGGR